MWRRVLTLFLILETLSSNFESLVLNAPYENYARATNKKTFEGARRELQSTVGVDRHEETNDSLLHVTAMSVGHEEFERLVHAATFLSRGAYKSHIASTTAVLRAEVLFNRPRVIHTSTFSSLSPSAVGRSVAAYISCPWVGANQSSGNVRETT